MLAFGALVLMTGCGERTSETEEVSTEAQERENARTVEEPEQTEELEQTEEPGQTEEPELLEESGQYAEENAADSCPDADEEEEWEAPRCVVLDNPSWEYYLAADNDSAKETAPISLQQQSKEANEIIDEEAWFQEYQMENPGLPYEDEQYCYERMINAEGASCLVLTEKESGKTVIYDLSEYQYAEEYLEADYNYIDQILFYAAVQEQILYLATGHRTYAESSPQTAYLTAVDLQTDTILWKSEPLTCNSSSFALLEDCLISGYGFTQEDDYLKIVSLRDGRVLDEIAVKSKPEYIVARENTLLVRTYDTNYEFAILRAR